jgi:hypothetical protein
MQKENKIINSKAFIGKTLVCLISAALLLQGCSGAPSGDPPRNKMPEFADMSNGFEGGGYSFQSRHTRNYSEFGLTLSNVDIGFMGTTEPCVSIALPSAADDSVAFSLVHTYGRFALPLLNEWSKRDRDGVVLDLREQPETNVVPHKTEYLVNCGNNRDIPVVFLWDQFSSQRAAAYAQLFDQLSGIGYRKLSSN